MDLRTRLVPWFLGLWVLVGAFVVLDHSLFRPREKWTGADRSALEAELDRMDAALGAARACAERSTIGRVGLVVSCTLPRIGPDQVVATLEQHGWRTLAPSHGAIANLCKGRYRAEVAFSPSHRLVLSMRVKAFERDRDCSG